MLAPEPVDIAGKHDMEEEILFSKYDILNVLEAQKRDVNKRVESIAAETLLNASEHDLVQALVEEFRLDVPMLKDNEIFVVHPERRNWMSAETATGSLVSRGLF